MLAVISFGLYAQDNPVLWRSKVGNVGENIYEIQFKASIEGDWHIYDLGPYNDGPISTTVELQGSGFKKVGNPYLLTKAHKKFDEAFGMEIGTCEDGTIIGQKVEVTTDKASTIDALI